MTDMQTADTFSPGVMLPNGNRYTPPNWMWLLGFALGGCDWAVEAIMADEHAFKQQILDYYREKKIAGLAARIRELEAELIRVRARYEAELNG